MHAVASPRLDRRIHRARTDPEWFCREVLGVTLWSKQAQILRAINRHPRVCVRSGHTTGKTHVAAAAALWFLLAYYPSKVITTAPTCPGTTCPVAFAIDRHAANAPAARSRCRCASLYFLLRLATAPHSPLRSASCCLLVI